MDQPGKPRTKRPDPKQFLKKRSNPVTQEEDKINSTKRSKSETVTTKNQAVADNNRIKSKQAGKVKEAVAASARVTRQRVMNVGAVKATNPRQGVKPSGMVKGLATSKIILTKKSKTAIPKHPLPFAAKNMFYDERWMEKQERGFVNWLNFILTPPEEHQGSDVKVKVDAGKLTLDIEKGRTRLAPTNEILSFRTYSAHRKLNRLRKSACRLFQSESVRRVVQKVEEEVENKRLLVRKDKMLHADVGAKQKVLDMLLSYNPLWLRVGLETIYGEIVPIHCNTDVYGLSQFIVLRVLGSPDIAEGFAHPTVPHLYRDGYAEATAQHTLKRFLMLVYFLDQAKQQALIDHNPCLFCKNSDIKTSKDMLLLFSRDFLSGEGDITRHLGYLGYKVTYSQTALDEFDFAVKSLGTDLRDGLRLARVMEVICGNTEQIRKSLRTPAISRLQKIHNMEVVYKVLEQLNIDSGVVTTRDLVDGHREKTLSFLWTIILHYQVAMVINVEQIKEEIQILERSLRLKKQLHKLVNLQPDASDKRRESEGPDLHTQDERLNLLMKWCRAVCAFYDIKVENFTVSFSDGRALCHILHYYHPKLLPLSEINTKTSMTHMEDMEKNCQQNLNCSLNDSVNSSAVFGDTVDPVLYEQLLANEKENFKKLSEKVKELGGIPLMLRWSDMSNTIPDEKVVVTYLMYLCARLLDIRHESRAARVIQHAWRAHRLRKMQALYEMKGKAVVVIQRTVRQFLQRMREMHQQSAVLCIQKFWRGHCARTEARNLRRDIMLQKHIHAVSIVQNAVKRYLHRRRYLVMKSAVIQVQAYCRGFLFRQTRQSAATNIQRVYKGHLARQQIRQMQSAAVKIQACVRSYLARKQLNKQVASARIIQHRYRACLAMRKQQCVYNNTRKACISIQKFWRRILVLKHQRQVKAAVTMQACFRCWLQKKQYQELREKTVYIQAAIRGCIQRQKFEKCRSAVLFIQRRFRNYLETRKQRQAFLEMKRAVIFMQSRRRMLVERKRYILVFSSATKLQASARMIIQRGKFQRLKSSALTLQRFYRAYLLMVACRRDYLITVGATITLQAGVRGMICRRQYKKTKQKVVLAQAVVRGHLQYKNFQNLKLATILVQKRYREILVAKQQRSEFIKMKQAVTVLQSAWRMRKERKNYSKLKSSVVLIQSVVRKMIHQNNYKKMKTAVTTLEKYYHAKVERDVCRRQFLVCKGAAMTLQAAFRGHQIRKAMRTRNEAAVKIQATFRGYAQRKEFLDLKKATVLCQRKFRLIKLGRKVQGQYLDARKAAITIQAAYKGYTQRRQYIKICHSVVKIQSVVRGYLQRQQYKNTYSAVIVIQRRIRETLLSRQQRECFLRLKQAAIVAQSVIRMKQEQKRFATSRAAAILIQSRVRGYIQHRKYKSLISAANIIQKYYRARTEAQICRRQFLIAKGAAITIQAYFKGYQVRMHKKLEMKSAVIIQSAFRGYCQRKQYLGLKNAAVVFQKHFRAVLMSRKMQKEYQSSRKAVIQLQAAVKTWSCRRKFLNLKDSVLKIQALYKMHAARQRYQKQRHAAVTIQSWFRGVMLTSTVRRNFLLQKGAAITIQAYAKMYRMRKLYLEAMATRKNTAAVRIQTCFRRYISVKKFQSLKSAVITCQRKYQAKCIRARKGQFYLNLKNRAAVKIQALWRGYQIRNTIKSKRLTLLRKRVKETAATVTEEKKLGNRTSSALDFLLHYKMLSQLIDALQHLDVASRLSWICCERMVEAIPVLYRLVETCNRSLPHMDIIKYIISILTNLAKYEKTRGAVYEADRAEAILVNLMQIYREKPPVFNKVCTLLGILALDTSCKTSILGDKKLVEKLTSIQSLTARKHKLEENQRVTRARMNASSLNATFLVSAPVKKHKIKPDWALHKDKMNNIENPLKAINFVLGNLGIKPKDR